MEKAIAFLVYNKCIYGNRRMWTAEREDYKIIFAKQNYEGRVRMGNDCNNYDVDTLQRKVVPVVIDID